MFSTSFADSSFAMSANHLHFGSTLKNEKLKKRRFSSSIMITPLQPYLKSQQIVVFVRY
jgi:hypothetical protein